VTIKKKDFIELEYTGKTKLDNTIFDTTDEKIAKENDIYNPQADYGPIIICVGQSHVVKGLDKHLEGKEPKGEYTFSLPAEDAFGKKDAKLIQLIPTNKFKKQQITPMIGLQVNIDGAVGKIKTVTGGRTLVDFNHPLSGKEVIYQVKINKVVSEKAEQIKALMKLLIGISEVTVKIANEEAIITLKHELPKGLHEKLEKEIKELVPVKKISFSKKEEAKQKEESGKKA